MPAPDMIILPTEPEVCTSAGAVWDTVFKEQAPPCSATTTCSTAVRLEYLGDEIPESFLAGLADMRAGRVVDMETALTQPPPQTS